PYYRDAVYDHFSKQEYQRRYRALRDKMRENKLDCVIVPGGPSHWSFGGGMQWLTGHWEWHAIAAYVVVPLEAEPTVVFSKAPTPRPAGANAPMLCPTCAIAVAANTPKSSSSGSRSSSSSAAASALSRSTRGTAIICRSINTTCCAGRCPK